jgi:hypothetical protein
MSFNDFLFSGFGILPKTSVAFPSGAVLGVWNDARHQDSKSHGGYEPDDEAVFTCATSLVANPKALIGQTVTKSGEAWRILRVRTGDAFTHFTLVSPDKA